MFRTSFSHIIFLIIAFGFLSLHKSAAQDTQTEEKITIERCYELAKNNYPLVKKYDLINITEDYSLKNATMMFFPQITLGGKATYQTDVLKFPFDIPGIDMPVFSKDQYAAYLELSQVIWDGGAISAQRKNIKAKGDVSRSEQDVDMYALKERINNLYFGILLLGEQIGQTEILLGDLKTNRTKIENCIKNGVANLSDLDVIEVEMISTNQRKVQLETLRDVYMRMLSMMIGKEVGSYSMLIKPIPDILNNKNLIADLIMGENKRPEIALFDARSKEINSQWNYWVAGGLPKIKLFIKGAYGRPGLNMMSDDFAFYAVGGINFSWNISELYSLNFGRKIISSSQKQVEYSRETFLFNTNLISQQQGAEIERYLKIMEDDKSVIALREKIRKAAETEFENGTMSASDLITEINKEEIAKQDKIVHEIELIKSIYELRTLKNN